MRVRTSISISEELQEQADQYAAETKRTFSAVVELALEEYLAARQDLKAGPASDNDSAKGGEAGISKTE